MFEDPAAIERIIGSFAVIILLVFALLAVLWIALPFSIFGIKDLLKKSIEEQKKTNELLTEFGREVSNLRTEETKRVERDDGREGTDDQIPRGPAF